MAVQPVRLLLAGRAGGVLFILAVEASRLHSSGDSGRGGAVGGLLATAARRRRKKSRTGLAVVHALVAAAPIVPALLIAYVVTERRLPAGRPTDFCSRGCDSCLCAAIALTLVSRLRLRMLRFVTLIPVVLSVAAVLKLGAIID